MAEKYALLAIGLCCALRFGPSKFVTGNDVGVDVKTHSSTCDYFSHTEEKKIGSDHNCDGTQRLHGENKWEKGSHCEPLPINA